MGSQVSMWQGMGKGVKKFEQARMVRGDHVTSE